MKKLFLMVILLASLLVLPFAAHATSITFGASGNAITFTGNGAGSLTVSTLGLSLSGNAFFDSDPLGTFSLGATSFTAGPVSAGNFNAGPNSEFFTFAGGDGDSLTGTIHWSFIQDNTTQPKLFGVLVIGTRSGDAAFTSNFSGSLANIDFITNPLSGGVHLDTLAFTTNSATATVSAGEVAPVPEPGTLALFGSGLLGLGGLIRRKLLQV
jgi:hypothetical protein